MAEDELTPAELVEREVADGVVRRLAKGHRKAPEGLREVDGQRLAGPGHRGEARARRPDRRRVQRPLLVRVGPRQEGKVEH